MCNPEVRPWGRWEPWESLQKGLMGVPDVELGLTVTERGEFRCSYIGSLDNGSSEISLCSHAQKPWWKRCIFRWNFEHGLLLTGWYMGPDDGNGRAWNRFDDWNTLVVFKWEVELSHLKRVITSLFFISLNLFPSLNNYIHIYLCYRIPNCFKVRNSL